MKKSLLFISTLFAAGTLGASAATTLLETTFSGLASATAISSATLVNTTATGVSVDSATLASLVGTGNTTSLGLQSLNAAGTSATFLAPNQNIGSSADNYWTATFSYSGLSGISNISSVLLDIGAFDSTGKWQSASASWSGTLTFTVSFTDTTTNSALGSLTGTLTGTESAKVAGNGSQNWKTIEATGTAIDLTNVSNLDVSVTVTNTSWSAGNFIGLTSISFIPEPSMFGLLAGTLALGFAGTRRRRNAKK